MKGSTNRQIHHNLLRCIQNLRPQRHTINTPIPPAGNCCGLPHMILARTTWNANSRTLHAITSTPHALATQFAEAKKKFHLTHIYISPRISICCMSHDLLSCMERLINRMSRIPLGPAFNDDGQVITFSLDIALAENNDLCLRGGFYFVKDNKRLLEMTNVGCTLYIINGTYKDKEPAPYIRSLREIFTQEAKRQSAQSTIYISTEYDKKEDIITLIKFGSVVLEKPLLLYRDG